MHYYCLKDGCNFRRAGILGGGDQLCWMAHRTVPGTVIFDKWIKRKFRIPLRLHPPPLTHRPQGSVYMSLIQGGLLWSPQTSCCAPFRASSNKQPCPIVSTFPVPRVCLTTHWWGCSADTSPSGPWAPRKQELGLVHDRSLKSHTAPGPRGTQHRHFHDIHTPSWLYTKT